MQAGGIEAGAEIARRCLHKISGVLRSQHRFILLANYRCRTRPLAGKARIVCLLNAESKIGAGEYARFRSIGLHQRHGGRRGIMAVQETDATANEHMRSEEHTSELQSLMRISYAVFCLKKKKTMNII